MQEGINMAHVEGVKKDKEKYTDCILVFCCFEETQWPWGLL